MRPNIHNAERRAALCRLRHAQLVEARRIRQAVADAYTLTLAHLRAPTRNTAFPIERIGRLQGHRDHSAALHGAAVIAARLARPAGGRLPAPHGPRYRRDARRYPRRRGRTQRRAASGRVARRVSGKGEGSPGQPPCLIADQCVRDMQRMCYIGMTGGLCMPIMPDLLTTKEAADELGLSPSGLRAAIFRGVLSVVPIDARTHGVLRSEIERYRRENLGQRGHRRGGGSAHRVGSPSTPTRGADTAEDQGTGEG